MDSAVEGSALENAFARQRAAQRRSGAPSAAERIDRLSRAIALLVERGEDLVAAMDADFGARSRDQSRLTDIVAAITPLKHARAKVRAWMRPERRAVDPLLGLLGGRAEVRFEPKGVVGILSPWNYPVNLVFGPLAGVFAAGNRAMLKPSEHAPATSETLARLIDTYFNEEELAVVLGGPEAAQAFTRLPFDHLVYTGSTAVGRAVMRAAADNLTPVTLELGGKCPAFVSRTADVMRAAGRLVTGKLVNAGQTCLAPDYVLVDAPVASMLTEALISEIGRQYPSLRDNPDYTAIINQRHVDRLQGLLEDARAKGAKIIEINPAQEDLSQQPFRRLAPTLVLDATADMAIMQEEIFGPYLPILKVNGLDEALETINRAPDPLAAYYFGDDRAEEQMFLSRTRSGGVTINDVIFHMAQEDLPFGGLGASGMGVYHGRDGFLEFSHRRAIYRQTNSALINILRPPYGDAFRAQVTSRLKR